MIGVTLKFETLKHVKKEDNVMTVQRIKLKRRGRVARRWAAAASLLVAVGPALATAVEQENALLLGSDTVAGDHFGIAADISGDAIVVGASVNDALGIDAGAAYIFRWNGTSWDQEALLHGSDTIAGDYFGNDVAVSGDTIVAGANGDGDNGSDSGSAYVFRWSGSSWAQEAKLVALDGSTEDAFGSRVALDGDVAVIGAHADDPGQRNAGSAYIFRRNGTSWGQEAKVFSDHADQNQIFGSAVAVSGDVVVVGAKWHEDYGGDSGAVFVYRWDGLAWNEEAELFPFDIHPWDWFGSSVGVDGDTIVVGRQEGGGFCGGGPGAAYIFEWDGASWNQTAKLEASDGRRGDRFGWSVDIEGDTVLVGANDWVQCGNAAAEPGRAYLYQWDGAAWVETKLVSSDGTNEDQFGQAVALSGGFRAVGSPLSDHAGGNAGAVYVYVVPEPAANCLLLIGITFLVAAWRKPGFPSRVNGHEFAKADGSRCYSS